MRLVLLLLISLFATDIFCQGTDEKLVISRLTDNFYVYTSYGSYNGAKVPANGMYLLTNAGAVIFDSPWDTTQFQPLLDTIKARHNKKAVLCIATHFHEDRTAGLAFYRKQSIKTFTTEKTDFLSLKTGKKRAEFLIKNDTTFHVGEYTFRTYYPGEGHAPDNIVVWFEKEKLLYGGCLIKSVEDKTLGNLSDANVKAYAITVEHVLAACKHPKYVITGHNNWKDTGSLNHTLRLARKLREEKQQQF